MKKLLFAVGALVATVAPVFAGDMPIQRRQYYQPDIAPLFNWTGFYVGANAGYGLGSAISTDINGFTGGLTAGYNYQVSPNWVLGAETDIAFSTADGNRAGRKYESDYIGTLRARLGYSVGNVMFYGTGGGAYGKGDLIQAGLSNDQVHWGWTLGAGVEAMLTQNISAKFEYLYVDLGDQTYQSTTGPQSIGYTTSLLRGGVNYKF